MQSNLKWVRVSRSAPCPICQKPDWCTVSNTGLVLCMRVESAKPSHNAMGGWLHTVAEPPQEFIKAPPPPKPTINSTALLKRWHRDTPPPALQSLAQSLGVSLPSLVALDAAWAKEHKAWAFPMRDGHGDPIGIRLRADDGRKWAVRGSRNGIFLPSVEPQRTVYVCEGPTDTAAALTLGLFAVGRPSCNCGGPEIRTACRRMNVLHAVIVADNDTPGIEGAKKIGAELRIPYCLFIPPAKDIREFVRCGGSLSVMEQITKGLIWQRG